MSLRAVLFDVDGTLADTEALGHRPAYNRAFRNLELPFRWGPKLYRKLLKQPGGRERLKHYLQHYQPELGPETVEAQQNVDAWVSKVHALKSHYFKRYMRHGRVPLRPGIARIMREARGSGVRLAIVTNASLKTLRPVLKYSMGPELAAEVEVIASGEEVQRKKPAPDLYQLAMRRLNLQPHECVALEDSEMGLEAAAAAGVAAVVTINRDTLEQDFTEAALVVSSLGEPGAPTRVLKGHLDGLPWVTLDTLQTVLAERNRPHETSRAAA
ncbi:HAD-IA family hydrolase [Solimonas variicoloris]|uniref:HAD-IA family hydrolase n=1 Tax=Solimonas variicoloris TaxID=254408 RepID=UPI000364BA64|nr:HAD-IA family hydrolase [Solimonas variicoloris]